MSLIEILKELVRETTTKNTGVSKLQQTKRVKAKTPAVKSKSFKNTAKKEDPHHHKLPKASIKKNVV